MADNDMEGRNALMGESSEQNRFKDSRLVGEFKSEKDKWMMSANPFDLEFQGVDKNSPEGMAAIKNWNRKPRVRMEEMNIGPPLDYSFQDLKQLSELAEHEPSAGISSLGCKPNTCCYSVVLLLLRLL